MFKIILLWVGITAVCLTAAYFIAQGVKNSKKKSAGIANKDNEKPLEVVDKKDEKPAQDKAA